MRQLHSNLRSRVPQIRCYKCGSHDVKELCHHCGRAMCEAHVQPEIPPWIAGKHEEFKGLGLERHLAGEEGKHCEGCLHFSLKQPAWVIRGSLLGALALLVVGLGLFGLSRATFMATMIGIVLGAILTYAVVQYRNMEEKRRYLLPLPVLGQLTQVKVEENVSGNIKFDQAGTYYSSKRSRLEMGEVEVKLKLNSLDRNRLQKYSKKNPHVNPLTLPLHAGFLVLHGRPNITIRSPLRSRSGQAQAHTMSLQSNVRSNVFLVGGSPGGSANLAEKFVYTFHQLPAVKGEILPVQIMPHVIRQGNGWSLGLLVQVPPELGVSELLGVKATIKELELKATPLWGMPESVSDACAVARSNKDNPFTTLRWKNIKFPENGKVSDKGAAGLNRDQGSQNGRSDREVEGGRKKFFVVRFANSITPETVKEPVRGRLLLRFDHVLSGINTVSYYFPTGKQHHLENVKQELFTNVTVDFELFLNSLSFQEPYSPPVGIIRPQPNEVPPNHQMVKRLSDRLAGQGVYVQRIIENEPRTSRASAKIINRYWRMEGRKYEGAYPIDFHIVIVGREYYTTGDMPDKGQTFCEPKIFAMVFNEEMRCKVDTFAEFLTTTVEHALNP